MDCGADGVCRMAPPGSNAQDPLTGSSSGRHRLDLEQPSMPAGDVLPLLFEESSSQTILEDEHGVKQGSQALVGKIVGLYFSAGWCPPCRKFSPELAAFRTNHQDDLTVCFVSCDNSETEMKQFVAGKGFLTVPFYSDARRDLQARLGVSMLPTLVIVDGTSGKVLTHWGRAAIVRNPNGCIESWKAGGHGCSWMQLVTGGSCAVQ